MWPVFPGDQTLVLVAMIAFAFWVSMRILQPAWWRSRPARIGFFAAFGAIALGLGCWALGRGLADLRIVHLGAGVAYAGILVLAPAAIVMPASALIDRGLMRLARPAPVLGDALERTEAEAKEEEEKEEKDEKPTRITRRGVIRFGTASLPAIAAGAGVTGLVTARRQPTIPIVRLAWPELHPDLDGLKILHLSDLHLGAYLQLEDLERALEKAKRDHRPDLVVLTGDVADVPDLIPGALRLVTEMRAPYGAIASLGNHEYLHGIEVTRPKYEASPVPLLVGTGRTLQIGRAKLFLGGSDDPVHMAGDIAWMVSGSIEEAAKHAPLDADFRMLLCHRPEGFDPAIDNGFDLTLSGHTHGGQLGLLGRSLLEHIRPGIGWWGAYAKQRSVTEAAAAAFARRTRTPGGPSRLYTTSGFGHWFPFRLGCPTEMPVVVLERGGKSGQSPNARSHETRVDGA